MPGIFRYKVVNAESIKSFFDEAIISRQFKQGCMLVYNVTIKVDHSIHDPWLQWMKEEHIPEMIATGCFTNGVILHLLESDDEEGITYAIQYHAENKSLYEKYINEYAPAMRKKGIEKWGDKFIAYRTLMQVVN